MFTESIKLKRAGEEELGKLKEAVRNPLMEQETRDKCKARIVFLEKNLGLLKKMFIPGFPGGNNICKK